MPRSLELDIISSLNIAANNSKALEAGLEELRKAVADRTWDKIEYIRTKMLSAVDGYVDNYVAAARRVEFEQAPRGR